VNLVNLEAVVKAYGPRVLLDGVSLGVSAGDRIGVVGNNGAGKTTLLTALAGAAELDSGQATRAGDVRLGYLPQSVELTGSVREAVFGSLAEHEWAGDARSRGVVTALLAGIDVRAALERLSGGERRRVALAALLLGRHDLLLLDEPTNHLDLEAIRWLAGYLREQAGAVVVVTHDRWFLDAVTERTWEVTDGQVHSYEGGYSAYVLARAERARVAEAADRRRRGLLRKELAWLRRGPPARTSKPKFRIDAATALIEDEPAPRDSVQLARIAAGRLGKTVIDIEDGSVSAGGRVLLDHVTWRLGPGDRVGVVGVNGSGKTTLLRLAAGDLPVSGDGGQDSLGRGGDVRRAVDGDQHGDLVAGSDQRAAVDVAEHGDLVASGRVVRGKTVRLGYLTQEPGQVDLGLRALEAAQQVRSSVRLGNREVSASQLLDLLGLRGDRQWTLVGELSGGERRRLQLLLLLMAEPNVLLLDEPTNDLDIETLTELEDLLDGLPGSLVVVSHDRYFLERVTDHVVALLDGNLSFLAGGVTEYLDRRDRQHELAQGPQRPGAGGPGPAGSAPGAASAAARRRDGQKELTRLERQLTKITAQEAELMKALAEHATEYPRLIELGAELRAAQEEKAGLEERWLTVAEELSE
jgi:ABC transport system ATP-binding/permease protein